jgi:Ribonuclease G/E
MSRREAYLDEAPGETRGVITLDGRPERLLLQRDDDDLRLALGARLAARVADVEPALGSAFLDLGGVEAILPFKPGERPVRGEMLVVELRSEPRSGKLAVARALSAGDAPPRLLSPPPALAGQLQALAAGAPPISGRLAREIADEAEAEVFETVHPLLGGGTIAVEPTRALTAIDVDLGVRKGADAKRATRQANLAAISEAARLLRLKSLGGLVVFDLAGRGHDGAALMATTRAVFGADNPGVAIGPVGRFGTMEITLPRRTAPLAERLARADGAPSDRTLAQRLIRRLETEAANHPGARLMATCAPAVAAEAARLADMLAMRIGARAVISAADWPREQIDVSLR